MARKSKDVARGMNVSPDDEALCFHEFSEKKAEIGRIQKSIRALFARYKNRGVDTAAIKFAYGQSLKENCVELQHSRTALMIRLGIITIEETGQGNFLGGLSVAGPSNDNMLKLQLGRIKSDGYNTGYNGGSVDASPWEPGTEQHVAWRESFFHGASDRTDHRPALAGVTAAAPRRRGRPSNAELAARAAAAASDQSAGALIQ